MDLKDLKYEVMQAQIDALEKENRLMKEQMNNLHKLLLKVAIAVDKEPVDKEEKVAKKTTSEHLKPIPMKSLNEKNEIRHSRDFEKYYASAKSMKEFNLQSLVQSENLRESYVENIFPETKITIDLTDDTDDSLGKGPYFVYFIAEEPFTGDVKIGRTTNLKARLTALQCGNPRDLTILHQYQISTWEKMCKMEKDLHRRFKDKRSREKNIHSEWFKLSPEEVFNVKL